MSQEIAQPAGIIGRLRSTGTLQAAGPPALRLSSAFLQFVATVLIARTLGESQSGIFFFWSAIVMSLGQVATFGLDKIALRQVPRLEDNSSSLNDFVSSIRSIGFVLAFSIGLILVGYAVWTHDDSAISPWWYALLPICLVGVSFCRLNGEILKGLSRPLLSIVYRHSLATSLFLILLFTFRIQLTPYLALLALTIAFFSAGTAAQASIGFRSLRGGLRTVGFGQIRSRLHEGWPLCTSAIFTSFFSIIPLAILERLHPTESVSFFTTSYRMFVLFELLSLAVHSISMPRLSRACHAKDWGRTQQIYTNTVKRGLLLIGVPMLGAIMFAGPVMSLFGEGFIAAKPILQVLLGLGLMSLALGPAEDLLLMAGKTRKLVILTFLKMCISILAAAILVPFYGPVGMAFALGGGVVIHKALCLLTNRTGDGA